MKEPNPRPLDPLTPRSKQVKSFRLSGIKNPSNEEETIDHHTIKNNNENTQESDKTEL